MGGGDAGAAPGRPGVGADDRGRRDAVDLVRELRDAAAGGRAEVVVHDTRCAGRLVLDGVFVRRQIRLVGCDLPDGISARRSRLGGLVLERCTVGSPVALDLQGAEITHDVVIDGGVVNGLVDATASRIGGTVRITSGARIHLGDRPTDGFPNSRLSVDLSGADIGGDVATTDATCEGGWALSQTHVAGQCRFGEKSEIGASSNGDSVSLDSARLDDGFRVEGPETVLHGRVRAVGAHLGGQFLIWGGAAIEGTKDGFSVLADGTCLTSDLVVGPARLAKALRLHSARVGGQLRLLGDVTIGKDTNNTSVIARSLIVDEDVIIRGAELPVDDGAPTVTAKLSGGIDLSDAHLKGSLSVNGTLTIGSNVFGNSLFADRLVVEGEVRLEPNVASTPFANRRGALRAVGALRLVDARVGGSLTIRDCAHVGHDQDRHSDLIRRGDDGEPRLIQDSLIAEGITIGRGLVIERCELTGGVALERAAIGGDLLVEVATIGRNGFNGTSVYMAHANVGGAIVIGRAATPWDEPPSAVLEGALVAPHATVAGAIDLSGATIGHTTSRLSDDDEVTVQMSGAHVDDLTLRPAIGGAKLDLQNIVVDGTLETIGVDAASEGRAGTLVLWDATIGTLKLKSPTPLAEVDLRGASVGFLNDRNDFWAVNLDPGPWRRWIRMPGRGWRGSVRRRVSGMHVARVPGSNQMTDGDRHEWLRTVLAPPSAPPQRGRLTEHLRRATDEMETGEAGIGPADSPDAPPTETRPIRAGRDVYRAFAAAQTASGEDAAATTTLIKMEWEHRNRFLGVLWSFIGQGYKPGRAFAFLLGLVAITIAVVGFARFDGGFVSVNEQPANKRADGVEEATKILVASNECDETEHENYPCLDVVAYTLDTLVPGMTLGETDRWQPPTTSGLLTGPNGLRLFLVLARILGWFLGFLCIYGLVNRALRLGPAP